MRIGDRFIKEGKANKTLLNQGMLPGQRVEWSQDYRGHFICYVGGDSEFSHYAKVMFDSGEVLTVTLQDLRQL